MLIDRRTFIGLLSGLSLGTTLTLYGRPWKLLSQAVNLAHAADEDDLLILPSVCDHDCGARCLMHVHVKNGKIIHITTDDGTLTGAGYGYNEPDRYQLRTCTRGRAYKAQVYSPLRITEPMKRTGERGEGKFSPISWDEALTTVAEKMKALTKRYGHGCIFSGTGSGTASALNSAMELMVLLANFGGFTGGWSSPSWEGAHFGMEFTLGRNDRFGPSEFADAADTEDILNSKLIILWGWNPTHTHFGTLTKYYLQRAREAGIPMICVDPVFTDTAGAWGSEWIPIRPGSDTAVLMAMAYVILKEDLADKRFVDRFTSGMDDYYDHLKGKPDGIVKDPQWASAKSGVPAEKIARLARRYATTKPANLVAGYAPGRTSFGEQYHRAAIALQALTGNIGKPGGGAAGHMIGKSLRYSTIVHFWWQRLMRDLQVNDASIATIKTTHLSDAILGGKGVDPNLIGSHKPLPSPIKMLYSVGWNPVNQLPNTNKTVKAFKELDFVVVQEQKMTPTAKYADILLPACTMLEREDFVWPWRDRDPYLIPCARAIEPIGDSKPDYWIFDQLSKRLGVKPLRMTRSPREWLDTLLDMDDHAPFSEMVKNGGLYKKRKRAWIPFQKNIRNPDRYPFQTPSGRIEIKSSRLEKMDFKKYSYGHHVSSLPTHLENSEGPNAKNNKYPLQLITTKVQFRCHTTFNGNPNLEELFVQDVWIHPEEARKRGIAEGQVVDVFNDRGRIQVKARVTERITPGVAMIYEGAWFQPDENGTDKGGCPNVLTSDESSPGGAFPYNSARVEIRGV